MSDSRSAIHVPEEYVAKINAARANRSMQGERRTVTILFCDVKGSTSMAEQLDPEEWAEIMNEAFNYLIAPVYRYEGTVARLMGDAILAFFGAPIAHEDDPQRAVLAGLGIVSGIQAFRERIRLEWGLDFNVRVGINTGSVVVGEIGSDLQMEYTAMGDAVNLASRIEASAQPGSVMISANTYRLVAPIFEVEDLGEMEVRGKDVPVRIYQVVGLRAQPGRLRGVEGLQAALVGRDQELEILRQALRDLRQGRGGVVTLIGEAGLGKSRLIDEIHADWKARGEPSGFWIKSRGVSYDTHRPYGLFRQQIRQSCGLMESDPPEVVRNKLMTSLPGNPNASQAEVGRLLRVIEVLLAFEGQPEQNRLSGEALKHEVFETIYDYYRQIGSTSSLVLVCEDLHWADPASVELLQHLLKLSEELPILFLCALRPLRHSPGWKIKTTSETDFPHRYLEINLKTLSEQETGNLVDELLAVADLPGDLRALLMRKAEGNPFFVEEVIRTLIDSGILVRDPSNGHWQATMRVEEITIPDNLQALITARIDRLDAEPRKTLQLAAVIGRNFFYRILERITEPAPKLPRQLNDLQRVDLIREIARQPELEYTFRHELTRDAAYLSILKRSRRQYHRQVGEAIEVLYPDRLEEQSDRLAYHFKEAGDAQKALNYYQMAGNVAADLYANLEAISHYQDALTILQSRLNPVATVPDEDEIQRMAYLTTRLGRVLEICGKYDEALSLYSEIEQFAISIKNPYLELSALIPQATIYSTPTGNIDQSSGLDKSLHALTLARQLHDPKSEAKALWNLMLLENYIRQNPFQAIVYGEEAQAIARQHGLEEVLAFTLHDLARSYLETQQKEAAWNSLRESQAIWRKLNNLPMLTDSLTTMADGNYLAGNHEEGILFAQEALRISQKIGNTWGQSFSLSSLGSLYLELGKFGTGMRALKDSIPLAEEANFVAPQISSRAILSFAYAYLGDRAAAIAWSNDLLSRLQKVEGFGFFRVIWRVQEALLSGDARLANQEVNKILAEISSHLTDIYFYGPAVIALLSQPAIEAGDFPRALEFSQIWIEKLSKDESRLFIPDLHLARGRALAGLGHLEAALGQMYTAAAEARHQHSRRCLWEILAYSIALEHQLDNQEAEAALRMEARQEVKFLLDQMDEPDLKKGFLNLDTVKTIMNA